MGNRCERQVDSLIGLQGEDYAAEVDTASFVESTSRRDPGWDRPTISWCDDRPDFFQRRFDDCVRDRDIKSCLSWVGCCGGSIGGTDCRVAEAEVSFVSKASKTSKPTRSPTRSPTPDSSVVSGFRAGQQAMQQWWKDEGSTCSNAWSGIINPAANEIKNSQFPNKGSSNTRARNQSAQLGVDSEVRAIQEECFSANDMDMEAY